jgi:(E)-4-hydroxy-3-methylbut-2-enyl-diphosphate synthase
MSLELPRRETRQLRIGLVAVGGGAAISVQSMTKTDTRDVGATVGQIRRLESAGCEVVRLAIPDREAAKALAEIKKATRLPLVADIHFDHRLALAALEAGADGLRINPGNIGPVWKVKEVVRALKEKNVPLRIGVNSGSLEKTLLLKHRGATAKAMVESALRHVRILEDLDFRLIKVSLKAPDIGRTLEAYRLMAKKVDYPFHAGITEAGGLVRGAVVSSAGLALLLNEGLADTIRVSLTAPPEEEVRVAYHTLSALGIRRKGITVVSCPICGRCDVDMAGIASRIEAELSGLEGRLTVAVMGCSVNGPGEAREADIGVACGKGLGVIFKEGKLFRKVAESRIAAEMTKEVKKMLAERSCGRKKTEGGGK